MDSGSGQAVEIAPFHSGGALKGFVVSGRWPDSNKEWAQLLMVAVRVASLPGLLATTTIFGAPSLNTRPCSRMMARLQKLVIASTLCETMTTAAPAARMLSSLMRHLR